jgi:hypothetical protein
LIQGEGKKTMKDLTRILAVTAIVGLVALAAAPTANASCVPNKDFSHWNLTTGTYTYITAPPGANPGTFIGRFWENNNRIAANEGTYDDSNWLKPYSGRWYTDAQMGSPGVVGCPAGNIVVFIQNNSGATGEFLVQVAPEQAGFFDLAAQGDQVMVAIPKPRLSNRAVAGNLRNFNANIDNAQAGAPGAAVGELSYRLVTKSGTATSDGGRGSAGWLVGPTITPGSPAPVSFDCTSTVTEHFVATQLVVDGLPSDIVSESTRVTCNPALADPDFKLIDRKPADVPRKPRR